MTSPTSLRVTGPDWLGLQEQLFTTDGDENALVLLCGHARATNSERLLVRHYVPVPRHDYAERLPYHLEVSPAFFNSIIDLSLKTRATPVVAHSHRHPGTARYSPSDDAGERRLLPVLSQLLQDTQPGSLLLTETAAAGRRLHDNRFHPMRDMVILNPRITTLALDGTTEEAGIPDQQWDRQLRAFGAEGQQRLQELHVTIIGLGGIGSAVAEQLVRAGVRHFTLVDPDHIEATNVSRLYGATLKDVGTPKVEVLGRHLERLGADTRLVADSAIRQTILQELRFTDLLFSCVDNDRTRAVMNRFAHQYLIPVIDMGVRLDAREGAMRAAAGRISIVGPGYTCLRCSHHLNAERIRSESLPLRERDELRREGYIMGIDEPTPAVISLNTTIAGLGVTAGLNLIVNLTGALQQVDQLYDATSGSLFSATPTHDPRCDVCSPRIGVQGIGDREIVSAYD